MKVQMNKKTRSAVGRRGMADVQYNGGVEDKGVYSPTSTFLAEPNRTRVGG